MAYPVVRKLNGEETELFMFNNFFQSINVRQLFKNVCYITHRSLVSRHVWTVHEFVISNTQVFYNKFVILLATRLHFKSAHHQLSFFAKSELNGDKVIHLGKLTDNIEVISKRFVIHSMIFMKHKSVREKLNKLVNQPTRTRSSSY